MIRLAHIDNDGKVIKEEKTTSYNNNIHSNCIEIDNNIVLNFDKFCYLYINGEFIEKEKILDNDEVILKTKLEKNLLVNNIEIVYKNITYQGDETSQDRISRAINSLTNDLQTITWKAKDNSKQILTRYELKQILSLAMQEQSKILFS